MEKRFLFGKTFSELKVIVSELEMPSFVAKQISEWLYKKHVTSIDQMSNISILNRTKLKERYEVGRTAYIDYVQSKDGTKKYLFPVNNFFIESVYIPEKERSTLCVSTQVGCKMNCKFCATGKQGFSANLTSGEILNQFQSISESDQLTNLVFMGMGEPFDNIKEVMKTLEILTSAYGYGWSPKRITVSTVGLIPGLKVFLAESNCHLAVSLHNPIAGERLSIMPAQKPYPIEDVIAEIKKYDFSGQRRVSFEYTMFKDINDQPKHINALLRLLDGLPCRINLIRFHTVPNVPMEGSSLPEMEKFRDALNSKGLVATIRKSRGEDILAACGLLSTKKLLESDK